MTKNLYSKLQPKRIFVVGDVMLDHYEFGRADRISPESPNPVFEIEKETYSLGGAANVAENIRAMGSIPMLMGLVGKDYAAKKIKELIGSMPERLIEDENRYTTTKRRSVVGRHQLSRADREHQTPIDNTAYGFFEVEIGQEKPAKRTEGILVSDYAKGMITQKTFDDLRRWSEEKNIPLFVDPKPKNPLNYTGATILKLNHKEAGELAGTDTKSNSDYSVEEAGRTLSNKYNTNTIITRADKGTTLVTKEGTVKEIPTRALEVYDVTGAGDTFIAMLAIAYCNGISLEDCVEMANHAAGIKVSKFGTSPVTLEELLK